MKKYLLLSPLLISMTMFSQVGIGTTSPDPSSILDIRSSNSGLLVPRVNLTSTTDAITIPNPAESLLVYNLNTINNVSRGFYYWQDNVWTPIKSNNDGGGSNTSWNLTGNSLTSGTEFLGTTNYNALNFRVNNQQVGRIHPNGGLAFGNGALANDNNSIAIGRSATSSSNNEAIAIGPSANASGFRSTAIGMQSVASNNNTLALGYFSSASGFQSTGIGVSSLSNTNNSLAIGNSSRATGQQATALGTEANSSGQNATAIGYQAIATQANSIILGNSANTNNRVGIGTNTPDERLHINGSIKIVDGTQAAGRILTSDATGRASWVSPSATKAYADIYYNGSGQAINSNANVTFGSTNISSNVAVNNTNLQVQTAGRYKITYRITLSKSNGGVDIIRYNLYRGFSNLIPGSATSVTIRRDEEVTVTASVIVNLNAFEQISVRSNVSDNNIFVLGNGSSLSIELVD
ncbi:hypothetical protein [Flavobacterium sp. N2820]|uniref:hypothetical protein n=1 Tax=Flavobacterium sp. N2820 TaxID=2986834 RepID=UPI002224EF26|nr:hypothetical protein [Flavobacterium sp. N2820]